MGKKIQCRYCKRFGHKEAFCFKKKEQEQQDHHAQLTQDEEVEELTAATTQVHLDGST